MDERLLDDHALVIGIAVRAAIRGNLVAVDLPLRRAGRAIRHAALLAALHITVMLANRAIHTRHLLLSFGRLCGNLFDHSVHFLAGKAQRIRNKNLCAGIA